jgi:hypothetical protein
MSAEQVQERIDEAVELAIVSGDLSVDEAIVKFEQATERLERARDSRGGDG